MSLSVYRMYRRLRGWAAAACIAFLGLLVMGLLSAAPRIYDCFRSQYENRPPVAWSGIVICAPEEAEPPPDAAVQAMLECLDGLGVEYDERALIGWTYYKVDDIINYPLPPGNLPIGFSNPLTHKIFVRGDLPEHVYRTVQLHETMHALRGGGHDPMYMICAGM